MYILNWHNMRPTNILENNKVSPYNKTISLNHIHFIDKIELILYQEVRNCITQLIFITYLSLSLLSWPELLPPRFLSCLSKFIMASLRTLLTMASTVCLASAFVVKLSAEAVCSNDSIRLLAPRNQIKIVKMAENPLNLQLLVGSNYIFILKLKKWICKKYVNSFHIAMFYFTSYHLKKNGDSESLVFWRFHNV